MDTSIELVHYIKNFVDDSHSVLQRFIAKGMLNNEFIKGNHDKKLDPRGETIINKKTEMDIYRERKVVNKIASIYLARYGILTKNLPIPGIIPYDNSSKSVRDSRLVNNFVNAFIADTNFRKTYATVVKRADVYGIEWLKTGIDWSVGDVICETDITTTGDNPTSMKATIREGRPTIEAVPIHEIFVDSYYIESIDDVNELVHRRVFPVDYIQQRWGVRVKPEPINDFNLSMYPRYSLGGRQLTHELELAYVYEYYKKPDAVYPDGRMCIVCGDTLIWDSILPYQNAKDGRRKIPFDPIQVQTVPNNLIGQPIYSQLIPIQETYNAVVNRYLEYMNHIAIGQFFYWEGSLLNKNSIINKPGALIGLKRNSKPPQPVVKDKLSQEFINYLKVLGDDMLEVAGLSQLTAFGASKSNVRTDGVVDKMSESDDNKLSNALDNISAGLIEAFKKLIYLEKEREKINIEKLKLRPDKDAYIKRYNLTDVDAEQITIVNHDFLMTNDQIVDKKLQQAISLGIYNPQMGLSYESKLEFLNAMGANYLKDTIDPQERATHDLCMEEQEALMTSGNIPNAETWHIHQQHIAEHNLFRISPEMRQLQHEDEKRWRQLQEAMNLHIHDHQEKMSATTQSNVLNNAKDMFAQRRK